MRYALTYGSLAGAIVIAIAVIGIHFNLPSHSAGAEWFGYLVMLAALSLIFVAVKRYRDVECGGVIKFGRAFGIGLSIAVVAALIYVIGWELYIATSDRDFIAEYAASLAENMRKDGAPAAAIEAKAAELREIGVKYRDPLFRIPVTFAEIFPVGLIVALASAALLRNPRLMPAAR